MKKIIIAAAIFFAATFTLSAQDEGASAGGAIDFTSFGGPVESGNILVNAGLAIDSGSFNSMGYYIPRIAVSGEYALQAGPVPLSFGLEIDYMANRSYTFYADAYSTANRITQIHNNLFFALVVNYHINLTALDNLDLYVGPRVGLCLDIINESVYHIDPLTGKYVTDTRIDTQPLFYAGGVIGATWYLTDKIGINAEVGYPVLIRGGITLKF